MWITPLSFPSTCQPGGEARPSGWEQLAGSYPQGKTNILLLPSPEIQITDEVLLFICLFFSPFWIPTSTGPILNKCELGQSIAILRFDASTAQANPRLLWGDLGVIRVPNTSPGKGRDAPMPPGRKKKDCQGTWSGGWQEAARPAEKWGSAGQTKAASSVIYCNGFRSEAVLLNPFLCSPVLSHVTRVSHGHQAHLHAGWAT